MRTSAPELNAKLSRKLIKDVARILRLADSPPFPDMCIFALIPFIVVAYMIVGYYVILAPGNLYNALVSEDWHMFRSGMAHFAIVVTSVLVLKVIRALLKQAAANVLREKLTRRLHALYLGAADREPGYKPSPYYRIALSGAVDNPDQRIASDTTEFSNCLVDILAGPYEQASGGVIEAVASVVLYTRTTWTRTGWFGVVAGYAWSLFVGVVSVFVINRTSPVVFRQEALEADLRYGHAHLRRHAEEVSFLRGAPAERRTLDAQLGAAVRNQWRVILRFLYLNAIQFGFSYYISFIMYGTLALAIRANVFHSWTDFTPGEKAKWISQTGSIFIQLLYSFTMMISLAKPLSTFVAIVDRLGGLLDALTPPARPPPARNAAHLDTEPLIRTASQAQSDSDGDGEGEGDVPAAHRVLHGENDGIAVDALYVAPADDRLVGPVSFALRRGESVLLRGATGAGKTSVLRVLRGLWAPAGGTAWLPGDETAVSFVPQRAYVPPGCTTLRDVLAYPRAAARSGDESDAMRAALDAVGWRRDETVQNALDTEADWAGALSPGEIQLLAAARVIVARPAYAVLDEPTAALDVAGERRVLAAIRAAGVSTITVGHAATLPALHDGVVDIGAPDG